MTRKPNNFPREGEHNPVTRDHIAKLENERPTLNRELHYTIGGPVEAEVCSSVSMEHESAILQGWRLLTLASGQLHSDHRAAARPEPEPQRAGGKHLSARAAYIREQKAAAQYGRTQNRKHKRGHIR